MLRVGDYKLIVKNDKVELFIVVEDLSETNDLSVTESERVQTMLARWKALNKTSQPPLWQPLTKKEELSDEYQYKDYEWLKGSAHYKFK